MIAIGAIVKDEFNHLEEWVAWHILQGFPKFFIADNGSSDGTCEYLEALEKYGICQTLKIPSKEKNQSKAYNDLVNKFGDQCYAIAFIDADEFICPSNPSINSGETQKSADILATTLENTGAAAIALNWKVFGSSGQIAKMPGLTIDRFNRCSDDARFINHHVKSVVRPTRIKKMHVHHAEPIGKFDYVNAAGESIKFFKGSNNNTETTNPTEFTKDICGNIRVNHYIVRSKQEFLEKKARRGWLNTGPSVELENYFSVHDLNDMECLSAKTYVHSIEKIMSDLRINLKKYTDFYKTYIGKIEHLDKYSIGGWCSEKSADSPTKARIKVYVNDVFCADFSALKYREDVISAGINKTGETGFHYIFDNPLSKGDKVKVSLVGNNFRFQQNEFII